MVRIAQHDAFPALRFDFFQEGLSVGAVAGGNLAYDDDGGFGVGFQPALQYGEALVKVACGFGHVENMEFDTAPVAFVRTDGGGNLLETAARSVKFAVYRIGWEIARIACWRGKRMSLPADKPFAVPIGAHAVEFFAHGPAGYFLVFIFLGKQQS